MDAATISGAMLGVGDPDPGFHAARILVMYLLADYVESFEHLSRSAMERDDFRDIAWLRSVAARKGTGHRGWSAR
jgi:hypothetical protein